MIVKMRVQRLAEVFKIRRAGACKNERVIVTPQGKARNAFAEAKKELGV